MKFKKYLFSNNFENLYSGPVIPDNSFILKNSTKIESLIFASGFSFEKILNCENRNIWKVFANAEKIKLYFKSLAWEPVKKLNIYNKSSCLFINNGIKIKIYFEDDDITFIEICNY